LTTRLHSTAPTVERAILVGVDLPKARIAVDESIEELGRLADTAGVGVAGRVVQTVRRVSPATYIGTGKVAELHDLVESTKANVVVFDDALSPAQQRNLE
jgi:GTP-binding protein HflX